MTSSSCNSCGAARFEKLLDLGPTPIAHRFLRAPAGPDEFKHPMIAHLCENCGLVQILNPIPPEQLYRDYNFCFTAWKPQPHMADEIALVKTQLAQSETIVELGSNDGTFLGELRKVGFTNVIGVEPNLVANMQARKTGASIYEGFFSEALADNIISEKGPASLVVSRQAVEHIIDLKGLARGVKRVLKPGGWLMLEVPDCESPLRYGDVSSLWEEHVNYFTEATFCDFLEREGFGVAEIRRYPFSGGALLVLAQLGAPAKESRLREIESSKAVSRGFAAQARTFQEKLIRRFRANRAAGRQNFLYGTGCRANMLLNGFNLHEYFDRVVDDQPEKQGLYMPGSRFKIESSAALRDAPGDCFLAVNAENEERVIAQHAGFVEKGGLFFSVNAPSPRLKDLAIEPTTATR